MKLLNIGANAKTIKSDAGGEYLTAILYLAPATTSGYQTCPSASVGCKASCLFTAGRGAMSNVEEARIRKTKLLFEKPDEFVAALTLDLMKFVNICNEKKVKPAVRLNGTSDINWYAKFPSLFDNEKLGDIQHYNYTKEQKVMTAYMEGRLPSNYYLTFSRSETNWKFCEDVLKNNHTVAAVFDNLPEEYNGVPVFDGDKTDLRFLDPNGEICGLKAKGKAKKDNTNFVIRSK